MKINLRKASHLVAEINRTANDIFNQLDFTVSINEFQIPVEELQKATSRLQLDSNRIIVLRNVVAKVRKEIGKKNAEVGINDLLTEKSHTESNKKYYENFTRGLVVLSMDEIKGRLEKIKAAKPDEFSFNRNTTVETSLFTEDDIKDFKSKVKVSSKELRDIDSDLLTRNIQNTIELNSDTVEVLEKEGLL